MSIDGTSGSDFERFRITFFEECNEILADLEVHLTQLQEGALDNEGLNAVFRAAHSIKAGAGAFGFTDLVNFTHSFEALLDKMRDGEIDQTPQVADLLVRGGDVLAELVSAAQENRNAGPDFGADVLEQVNDLLGNAPKPTDAPASADAQHGEISSGMGNWTIQLTPNVDLFKNATEPLLLIRELRELGALKVNCDRSQLPPLRKLDPELAYFSWAFELESECSRENIEEVFEFVDDTCEIAIERAVSSENDAKSDEAPPQGAEVQPEASLPAKSVAAKEVAPAGKKAKAAAASSIRVELGRIDRLVNTVGELVITQAMLAQELADLTSDVERQPIAGQEQLANLTRELQECVMAIRMQPVKSVFARMPRLVRDLSGKLGKKINLRMSGEHTEVDKTIIEELADPLTHMIRNSIDHGLETPDERVAAGKAEEGTIDLSAAHVGGNIVISISDDGAGINRERVLAIAIDKGIVQPDAHLTDQEIDELIFAPGFSTAEEVTDISGRGVGMDVVRRNIVSLGGRIQIQSQPGHGTRLNMLIPLTLAVLDGMIVAVGNQRYILPITSIVESFRPSPSQMRRLDDWTQVVQIRGEFIRIVRLCDLFNVENATHDPTQGLVVLTEVAGGGKIGITVDELIGQQQIVIKSLNDNFDPVPGISGATILGNGKVALILDIEQLAGMKGTVPLPQERGDAKEVDAPVAIVAAE
ncbi:chemotaxis protein CheA [Labrenzia sp. CE80]|uniref:chemotaxis protein CheA n=1 Tax=Labrenzia sp. CE80 TaxID=1788986 RepID=UPI00129A184E|nr:chemotaxis protein CheA [Labrenzia sp. CE80]